MIPRLTLAATASVLLLCGLFAAGSAAAPGPPAKASVIGGKTVSIADLPSLAIVREEGRFACTGTVVAPRVVLTAGHCVENVESRSILPPRWAEVPSGVTDMFRLERSSRFYVERVLAFPGFTGPGLRGDAGLLILDQPTRAHPIALAGAADAPLYSPGTRITIAGWGASDRAEHVETEQLQAGVTTIEDTARCDGEVRGFYRAFDPATQFCAQDKARDAVAPCHGDSGGPAIATRPDGTPVEVGIISIGIETCDPAESSVFTRVDSVAPWVESWIAAVEAGGPEPRVRIPRVHKPTLGRETAELIAEFEIEEDLGRRSSPSPEVKCHRRSRSRQVCRVSWRKPGRLYSGSAAVFFAIRHNTIVTVVHYRIRSISESCAREADDRRSCPAQTLRG